MTEEERAATATPDSDEDSSADSDTQDQPDERTRVLRMLSEGRITVDEAVELLKALTSEAEAAEHPQGAGPWGWQWHAGPQAGVHVPVPPVPPIPPVPPVPPGPFAFSFPPFAGAQVLAYKGFKRGARRGAPMPPTPPVPWMTNRDLVFEVEHEGNRYNARLPIGLVGEFDRYLPRPIRTSLESVEVDVPQLLELVNNMDPGHGGKLIDIEHEGNRVRVGVEIPGHPELGKAF